MSTEDQKIKRSTRLQKEENAIKKQVKIAKSKGTFNQANIDQPHRLAKHHAMDCGNPDCYLCGNPRKTHKDKLTQQEKRLFQDVEKTSDRHSNGLKNDEEDIL
jgi:hypothetical protein